jgi:tripartite-type tricarboxylate transporter receptor subunit TctC
MIQTRRSALHGAIASTALVLGPFWLWPAQCATPYPVKPIRILVTTSPGGTPDLIARVLAQRLQDRLGQAVVVENRTGANGNVAAGVLAASKADGYTLMVTDGSILSINPHLYSKLSYDPRRALVPVSLLGRAPTFLTVHPTVPVSTLHEFINYAKSHELNYGSSGVGTAHHLSMEALRIKFDLKLTHVPYKGAGQSVPALAAGEIQALFASYPAVVGFARSNRVKLLATNGAKRSALAPDVPAIGEFIPDYDFTSTMGIFAPEGTPHEVIEKLAADAALIMKSPPVVEELAKAGIEAEGEGPQSYALAVQSENARMEEVIRAAGIAPEE